MAYTSTKSTKQSKSSTTRPSVSGIPSSPRPKENKTATEAMSATEHKSATPRSKTSRPTRSRPTRSGPTTAPRLTPSRSTSSGSTTKPTTPRSMSSESMPSKPTSSNPKRLSKLISRLTTSRLTPTSARAATESRSPTASRPAPESKNPPKSQAERQIQTLGAVADGKFSLSRRQDRYDTPYDGKTVALLSMNHCLAAQDPSSSRVVRFVEQYDELKTWDLNTVDLEVLRGQLQQFFARFDELFFFGLLSRKVDSPMGRRPLLAVEVIDDYDREFRLTGRYKPLLDEWKVMIWLRGYRHPDRRLSFRTILGTLLHELTHAYLGLAGERHRNHLKWVAECKLHGEYFWTLLRAHAEIILNFTRSPSWRDEVDMIEDECERINQRKSTMLNCRTQ
ncbi:hypothetical protein GGR58DRAFT_496351 [Xylaria digitata]|nr:hypothetical protein GGR58DRAFT_496351 [Xylaria digitata]